MVLVAVLVFLLMRQVLPLAAGLAEASRSVRMAR